MNKLRLLLILSAVFCFENNPQYCICAMTGVVLMVIYLLLLYLYFQTRINREQQQWLNEIAEIESGVSVDADGKYSHLLEVTHTD